MDGTETAFADTQSQTAEMGGEIMIGTTKWKKATKNPHKNKSSEFQEVSGSCKYN